MSSTPHNPIIPGFHPDPTICRVGEDYWIAVSSFEYFPGIPIFHSKDLVNWTLVNHAINRNEQMTFRGHQASQGLFAPTLRYNNGTFYIICTDVGGIGNFIITTDDPSKHWSLPIKIQEGDGFNWFDPSLFFDDDGKVYYTRRQEFRIVQAEIDVQTGELLTSLNTIHEQFTSDDIEGPHLYKINNQYYLIAAEGGTGFGHAISIGKSNSPWGPFTPCERNPILSHRHLVNHPIRYTGHGDLIEDHMGNWWIVFLATRHQEQEGAPFHHLGRETFLAPVRWENDWPIINENKKIGIEIKGNLPPEGKKTSTPSKIILGEEPLEKQWTYRREYCPDLFKLRKGDGLELWGCSNTLSETGQQTFIGQRLEQPFFRIQTELHFSPKNQGEEAGLTLFMSESFHSEISLIKQNGSIDLIVRQSVADLKAISHCSSYSNESILLEIKGNWEGFTLSAGIDESKLKRIKFLDRRLLCTEISKGWTGLFVALFATGNGKKAQTPALFKWFEHLKMNC